MLCAKTVQVYNAYGQDMEKALDHLMKLKLGVKESVAGKALEEEEEEQLKAFQREVSTMFCAGVLKCSESCRGQHFGQG